MESSGPPEFLYRRDYFFKNSSIGPFKPVKNDTSVDLFFLDMEKGRGYLDTREHKDYLSVDV